MAVQREQVVQTAEKYVSRGKFEPAIREYRKAMVDLAFSRALESLWRVLDETSQYIVSREPWKIIKTEGASPRLARILWVGLEAVRIVATGLLPFMPRIAPQVLAAIGNPVPPKTFDAMTWGGPYATPTDAILPEPAPLFPRIDKEAYLAEARAEKEKSMETAATPEKPLVSIDQFFQAELKVATITAAVASRAGATKVR